ncbi:MAG: ABC transporter permease [Synergistaceae bacterium]|jgi:ABC-2 type transport system permease protein|nr:ABC transporter permease [Synergistaceae bacterium]
MGDFIFEVMVLTYKEATMILKDKTIRLILVMPVIIQSLLFGYVATFDLNNVEYALLDEDRSGASRELVALFDGSVFHRVATLRNASDIAPMLDRKKAMMVLHIGYGFERGVNMGVPTEVQVLVDGRNSNVAGTAMSYASSIIDSYSEQVSGQNAGGASPTSRAWFNPNLETRWNILSGLLAVLSAVEVMVLAGQSVSRERENGTFDQLLVTPLGPMVIMLGKAIPPVLVGVGQMTLCLLVSLYWFEVPYGGSYVLLYVGMFLFNCAVVGVGLCVSAMAATMQQALLFTFTLMMPMILLSGLTTPVASMPDGLQYATLLNPVRYGVEFAQRVYLEGAGWHETRGLLLPMVVIAAVTLSAAAKMFRGRMS